MKLEAQCDLKYLCTMRFGEEGCVTAANWWYVMHLMLHWEQGNRTALDWDRWSSDVDTGKIRPRRFRKVLIRMRKICSHDLPIGLFTPVHEFSGYQHLSSYLFVDTLPDSCLRNKALSNLVDPASSHMLVWKIKPCMSQYKFLYSKTANGSVKQLQFFWQLVRTLDTYGNSRANTCP